ncbi:unnamed protein product [Phytomonas sp. Hart1]|nr:unnamed protein product [Phytomonas sp. Hart1]|eukprot:CCW68076.1 unnamed protein product [Phytomonas sp. isolate Hart1]
MKFKNYIGRQLRPSQLAAELLPADQQWCALCHQAIPKKFLAAHQQLSSHRQAARKINKLKGLSLMMWEAHRGAPLSEESAKETDIAREFEHFRKDQQRRERAELEAWRVSSGFSK